MQVEVWRKDRVEERQYETSYKWMAEKATQGIFYQLFSIFGARYKKLMFIVWQFIYTIVTILIGYNCYHRYIMLHFVAVNFMGETWDSSPPLNIPVPIYLLVMR